VRLKIVDPSGSIRLDRSWAPANPTSCAARRRIRAIENLGNPLLPSLVQRQATILVALQPPLAYCVTEFGRLFVGQPGVRMYDSIQSRVPQRDVAGCTRFLGFPIIVSMAFSACSAASKEAPAASANSSPSAS